MLPISELVNYPEVLQRCPALRNIAPSGFDLSIYARDGRAWWQAEHVPFDSAKFWSLPLRPEHIDLDGNIADFGRAWTQLNRLVSGIGEANRKNNSRPAWANGNSLCVNQLTESMAESFNAASLMARIDRLIEETRSNAPELWGAVVAGCPALNPREILASINDANQQSQFIRKLIKYNPNGGSSEQLDQLAAVRLGPDEIRNALLFLLLLRCAGIPLVPAASEVANLQHETLAALITVESLPGRKARLAFLEYAEANQLCILVTTALHEPIPSGDLRGDPEPNMLAYKPPLQIVRDPDLVDQLHDGSFLIILRQKYQEWQCQNSLLPPRSSL